MMCSSSGRTSGSSSTSSMRAMPEVASRAASVPEYGCRAGRVNAVKMPEEAAHFLGWRRLYRELAVDLDPLHRAQRLAFAVMPLRPLAVAPCQRRFPRQPHRGAVVAADEVESRLLPTRASRIIERGRIASLGHRRSGSLSMMADSSKQRARLLLPFTTVAVRKNGIQQTAGRC